MRDYGRLSRHDGGVLFVAPVLTGQTAILRSPAGQDYYQLSSRATGQPSRCRRVLGAAAGPTPATSGCSQEIHTPRALPGGNGVHLRIRVLIVSNHEMQNADSNM